MNIYFLMKLSRPRQSVPPPPPQGWETPQDANWGPPQTWPLRQRPGGWGGGGASSLPPVAPLPLSRRATNLGKAIVQIAPPPFSRASVYSTVRVLK